jgi:hypothetical protein
LEGEETDAEQEAGPEAADERGPAPAADPAFGRMHEEAAHGEDRSHRRRPQQFGIVEAVRRPPADRLEADVEVGGEQDGEERRLGRDQEHHRPPAVRGGAGGNGRLGDRRGHVGETVRFPREREPKASVGHCSCSSG